jgi:hypothetical protein
MQSFTIKASGAVAISVGLLTTIPAEAAPIPFNVGGSNLTSSIQGTVDAFRAALGDPNNGNAPGPLFSGRREINWDGGNPALTDNAVGPSLFNVFLNTRGAQFITPGAGGFVQGPPSGGAQNGLAGLFSNPTYGNIFGVFSPSRDFTPIGSNITDGLFFIPGTNGGTAAEVRGFGAVFTDIDLAGSTTLQYFDRNGNPLLTSPQSVLPGTVANASLSFAGVVFNAGEEIFRVRITSGNTALAPGVNDGGSIDLVVMDDSCTLNPRRWRPCLSQPACRCSERPLL